MKVRIQKLLAAAGFDARRKIEEMVLAGRVAVNGKKVRTLPVLVNDEADTIEVDDVEVYSPRKAKRGEAAAPDDLVYVVMNKPEKVYCTNVAQGEQTRAIDLLPPHFRTRVYPVGRLDAESRGLLLLTNDGDLTNKLTHPRYGISKIYRAVIDGSIDGDSIQQLVHGVWLADPSQGKGFKAKAAKVEVIKRTRERSIIDITLEEGRNRQIRRMLAKAGHKVRNLTRIRFGPLDLNKLGLQPGDSRLLLPREVTALKRAADSGARREAAGDVAENRDLTPKQRRDKAEAAGQLPKQAKPAKDSKPAKPAAAKPARSPRKP